MKDERIAGALVDFVGYLTTRPDTMAVGANVAVYGMHEALETWAALRQFSITPANVETWNETEETKESA